jgi:hypothetical protein
MPTASAKETDEIIAVARNGEHRAAIRIHPNPFS